MPRTRAILLVALLALPLKASAAPKLVVIVAVDQLRADYLDRFAGDWTAGWARLKNEGAVFVRARHSHVPTETAVGHATLATGCFPAQHGIIGNRWWDKVEGKPVKAVDDPEHGVGPAQLRCPTLGEALKEEQPRAKSAAVSGKDRGAVLMAGRRADVALWPDRKTGRFGTSGAYRTPDWLPAWKGLSEQPTYAEVDEATLALARRIIEKEGFGGDSVPDVLSISLSSLDRAGHKHGPDSAEVREHLRVLDRALGELLAFLDKRLGRDGYALALSSDHGVGGLPESEAGKAAGFSRVGYEALIAYLDKELAAKLGAAAPGRRWIEGLAQPHLYLDYETARLNKVDPGHLRHEVARVLAAHPAVAAVHWPERLRRSADGPFGEVFKRSVHEPRSGDLLILFKEGVEPSYDDDETSAVHGVPYDYDSLVPVVLIGAGIRPGRHDNEVLTVDLAPTLGRLLGLKSFKPAGGGRVLSESLVP